MKIQIIEDLFQTKAGFESKVLEQSLTQYKIKNTVNVEVWVDKNVCKVIEIKHFPPFTTQTMAVLYLQTVLRTAISKQFHLVWTTLVTSVEINKTYYTSIDVFVGVDSKRFCDYYGFPNLVFMDNKFYPKKEDKNVSLIVCWKN